MKQINIMGREESIVIPNPLHVPNLVILFPITRTGPEALEHWHRLISTINISVIHALVVIDKTENGSAKEFFLKLREGINAQLFILTRSANEPIFDSQKYIVLDELLWIQQLHDDDLWEGTIEIPADAEPSDLFLVDFYVNGSGTWLRVDESNMPPARVVFSLTPSIIWNRFGEFIFAQGGHVAGSVDSTLATVAHLGCRLRSLPNFRYLYSEYHWSKRKDASTHLKKLSSADGWGHFASAEVAVLNRTFDNLSALAFFEKLLPNSDLKKVKTELIDSFRPSLRKRYFVLVAYFFTAYCSFPILSLAFKLGYKMVLPTHNRLKEYLKLNRLLQASWKLKDLSQLLDFIESEMVDESTLSLSKRFNFWRDQIAILGKISS